MDRRTISDLAPHFRLLVVDDSSSVRAATQNELEKVGYKVVSVDSGEAALMRAMDEDFDLIVSDVQMGAITGIQLCRILRSDPGSRTLPIVLLTSATDAVHRFWGDHAGADAYIDKAEMRATCPNGGGTSGRQSAHARQPTSPAKRFSYRTAKPCPRPKFVFGGAHQQNARADGLRARPRVAGWTKR
ncbi:MAG: response regulator [Polyangiales bacterium]